MITVASILRASSPPLEPSGVAQGGHVVPSVNSISSSAAQANSSLMSTSVMGSSASDSSNGPSTSSSSKTSSSTSLIFLGSSGSLNQRCNQEALNKSRYSRNLEPYNDTASVSSGESAAADFEAQSPRQQLNSEHLAVCLKAMNAMRYNGQLCDVVLRSDSLSGSQQLSAHRLVLAASSAYFFAMFNGELAERNRSEVTLHSVDGLALQLIVDFCYTGEIVINQNNVQHLLPAANFLQVETVREACCKFLLSQLEPSNCLGIRSFADANCCLDLQGRSHRFALHNFHNVSLTEEFLQLDVQHVEDLVSSNELNVPAEECVYKAIMRWVKHESGRERNLERLLRHCRLPLVDRHFLLSDVSEEPL
ncbi:actin binding protein-like, partial [Tropilaelaps mercedesae]